MDDEIRYVRSGGVAIAYQVVGEGEVDLVFVPAYGSNLVYGWMWPKWRDFYERLARSFRLILFDKRGTGLSDHGAQFATLETRMEDLRAVLEAAGAPAPAVLAANEGCGMAALFAATYPERVRALVLFNPYAVDEVSGGTLGELAELLEDNPPIDRTTLNAWEDADFVAAVRAIGRRKLMLCALWTEICMAFPALDALREGYDVYPVVDAIGGTSEEAHRAGLGRVVQAGGRPISWVALACELQRDWAREETVADVVEIVLTERLLQP